MHSCVPARDLAGTSPDRCLHRCRAGALDRRRVRGRVLLRGGAGAEQDRRGPGARLLPRRLPTKVIDASKDEGGELTIYSNTAEENWAPIFRDFQKKYPWVEKLSANDLDSDEVFQKVLSEQATGSSPVDMVVSNAATAWATFAERPDTLMDYESPELAELPDFAPAAAQRLRDVGRPHDDRLQHGAHGEGPDRHRRPGRHRRGRPGHLRRTRSPSATRRARSASRSPARFTEAQPRRLGRPREAPPA